MGGRVWSWVGGAALVGAAAAQIVPNAGRLNADGVAYLDLAQRLAAGYYGDVFLGYWSPLFSILVAPFLAVFPLSPPHDNAIGFGVLFLTFLLGAAGFRYLLRQLPVSESDDPRGRAAFRLAAWSLFAWATLGLIRLHYISPDVLTAGLFFWATGLALRAQRGGGRGAMAAAFGAGAAWGLAGLAKAAMIPLAAVGLVAIVLAAEGWRPALRRGALALVGWLIVAGPFLTGLSIKAGYPTIGSAGRLNYRWAVVQYRGEFSGEVVERIRVRAMPVEPRITQLYRYDPARPHRDRPATEAAPPRYQLQLPSLWGQLRRLIISAEKYWLLFGPIFATLIALLLMDLPGLRDRRWRVLTPVWLPALGGLGLYALVVALPRYVAPFFALLALTVLAAARPAGRYAPARAPVLGGLATVLLAFAAMASVYTARLPGPPDAGLARRVLEAGPDRGDPVAVVGKPLELSPMLRAAGLQVAATVAREEVPRFRVVDADIRQAALDEMLAAGARWVVLQKPVQHPGPEWRKVRASDLWVRPLVPPTD